MVITGECGKLQSVDDVGAGGAGVGGSAATGNVNGNGNTGAQGGNGAGGTGVNNGRRLKQQVPCLLDLVFIYLMNKQYQPAWQCLPSCRMLASQLLGPHCGYCSSMQCSGNPSP